MAVGRGPYFGGGVAFPAIQDAPDQGVVGPLVLVVGNRGMGKHFMRIGMLSRYGLRLLR